MSLQLRLQQAIDDRQLTAYSVDELIPHIGKLLWQTYVLVGFRMPDEKDVALLTAKLATDLRESYPFLTLPELSLCFELGVKGEYGDFMGINLRTLTAWLKAYKVSDLRYRAVVAREQSRNRKALPTVSEETREASERAFLNSVFHRYRDGYPLDCLYPAYVYRRLTERGLICDDAATKWEAMRLASAYKPAAGNLRMDDETRQALIRQRAMAICLRRFFDRLIEDGRELFGRSG